MESRMDPMEGEEVWELGYSAEISMPGRLTVSNTRRLYFSEDASLDHARPPEGQIPLLEQVPSRGQRQENTQN